MSNKRNSLVDYAWVLVMPRYPKHYENNGHIYGHSKVEKLYSLFILIVEICTPQDVDIHFIEWCGETKYPSSLSGF